MVTGHLLMKIMRYDQKLQNPVVKLFRQLLFRKVKNKL